MVGNMNNSGFAIMRYFRDLGADAYLLPFSTDSEGNLAHFMPLADTWFPERWMPYIHALDVPNSTGALWSRRGVFWSAARRRELNALFEGYERFIGTGIAPTLFTVLGRRLDIFFPYSTGIEFYGNAELRNGIRSSFARRIAYTGLRRLQASGIRASRYCLNAEMSLTQDSLNRIGKDFQRLAIPAFYNREVVPVHLPARTEAVTERMRAADLSLFSCARLLWVRDPLLSDREWRSVTKNSDWIFRGLARFVAAHPGVKVLLTVVEYGPDVEEAKQLVGALGLHDHVLWLPTLPRREIMALLAAVDLGVGEFYSDHGVIWGGTGWEVLASGRPLLQSFNFTAQEFSAEFGHAPPPILDVKAPEDFAAHLSACWRDPGRMRAAGEASLDWFNRHNGIGLARRWLALLTDSQSSGLR